MSALFDKTTNVLSKAMDLYLLRHAVITDNIANAETPGYKSRRIDFENQLQDAIRTDVKTGAGSVASIRPKVYEDPEAEVGQDRNSVDMDREMARLTKNDLKYSAATQAVSKKFALLKFAIREGNGR